MKKTIGMALLLLALLLLTGCAATQKQLAKNLGQKSLMGDGLIAINQITMTDPAAESFTPELKSVFVSGKFLSLIKDTTFLAYDKKSSAATFNSSAVTTMESLVIQTGKSGDLAATLQKIVELQKAGTSSAGSAPENK